MSSSRADDPGAVVLPDPAEADERVLAAIARLGRLPVLHATVRRLVSLAEDDEASLGDVVAALEADQGLAADVLRYANSAASARRMRARSIRAAVTYVGRRAIAQLALEAVTCRFMERAPGNGGASIGQLHLHAAATGMTSQHVAERAGASPEVAHLAGLLHDVGKLVLPLAFGAAATDAIAVEHGSTPTRAHAERARLGLDHAHAGALMARASSVDVAVERAIAFHHGGPDGAVLPTSESACVAVANEITGMLAGRAPDVPLLERALDLLGLSDDIVDELALEAAQRAQAPGDGLAGKVAALERLAHTDDLTGLPNRRQWMRTVSAHLDTGAAGTILLCDVDEFKLVNDEHGHAAGDLVLTEVARILSLHGAAGRLGGDEFAVWVPGPQEAGDRAADQILADVAHAFQGRGVGGLRVGVSIGAASGPSDGAGLGVLMPAADEALYSAKRAGRGRALRCAR